MFKPKINTVESMVNPDVNDPNLDEDGEQDDTGPNNDVNGSPEGEEEDSLESDAKDLTPRIYEVVMGALPAKEHSDLTVRYASKSGMQQKRRIFKGPVTAYQLAQALLDVDSW